MNVPVPSAVPSANATLKEDSSATSTLSSGIMKTIAGEVLVSCMTAESSSSTEILTFLALGQIIYANQQELLQQNNECSHQLFFLSPEAVQLEAEVLAFLSEMGNASNVADTSETQQPQNKQEEALPQESNGKQSLVFSRSSKPLIFQNPKQQSLTITTESSLKKQSETESHEIHTHNTPFPTNSGLQKCLPLQVNAQQKILSDQKEAKLLTPLSQRSTEKQEESLITSKADDLHKKHDDGQEQEHHDQRQHQEEEGQPKKKKKKHSLDLDDLTEHPRQTLNIADLIFSDQIRCSPEETPKEQTSFRKKLPSPMSVFSKTSPFKTSLSRNSSINTPIKTPKVENVFLKFMRLMARILGQAEAEANELYMRVKKRTDDVDTLTVLISKINNEKKDIDWSKDEEMKALVNKAKEIGVTIEADKYSWTEEEKRLLKENVQMRKENMEKITQMERTDMQRHLQEISQCHQARSNVLKLLKELMDTFIYNLRP